MNEKTLRMAKRLCQNSGDDQTIDDIVSALHGIGPILNHSGNQLAALLLRHIIACEEGRSVLCGDSARADQLAINSRWMMSKLDAIHDALCPSHIGTWQDRVEKAVEAAESLATLRDGQATGSGG